MNEFKKGDRVRVCWIDEDTLQNIQHFGGHNPIGDTGTVYSVDYNPHMHRIEVLVDKDNESPHPWKAVHHMYSPEELELI